MVSEACRQAWGGESAQGLGRTYPRKVTGFSRKASSSSKQLSEDKFAVVVTFYGTRVKGALGSVISRCPNRLHSELDPLRPCTP